MRQLPADSAYARAIDPDLSWDMHAQLLAGIWDAIQQGNWQRQGDKNAPKPKPLPRPGVTNRQSRRHGQTHLSREAALAILRPPTEGGDDVD